MEDKILTILQNENDTGALRVRTATAAGFRPVSNATVRISRSGDEENVIREVQTDVNGQTEDVVLETPPLQYSLTPDSLQPYAEYTIIVDAEGYEQFVLSNIQILPNVIAIAEVTMQPVLENGDENDIFNIGPHTLYYEYPPKIAEAEIKPVSETGEIVLTSVVVPEYIVVHDGPPTDATAKNYYVRYADYIKNVASSEIYATWPVETIKANVLAIMSFTLNRVYTEWYRNKGYDFTITSSTAYDHKWINERNIFDTISLIVDELFTSYLSRPGVKQPILTQYCDGRNVTCPNWMSQWGSKALGDRNLNAIEILRSYYGDDIYINNAESVAGIPLSWPGENLTIGSTGDAVSQIQEQLNEIGEVYTLIPDIEVDGSYGNNTSEAVRAFQKIFDLPQTGIVDFKTWYKISAIYVAVTRIAELR